MPFKQTVGGSNPPQRTKNQKLNLVDPPAGGLSSKRFRLGRTGSGSNPPQRTKNSQEGIFLLLEIFWKQVYYLTIKKKGGWNMLKHDFVPMGQESGVSVSRDGRFVASFTGILPVEEVSGPYPNMDKTKPAEKEETIHALV